MSGRSFSTTDMLVPTPGTAGGFSVVLDEERELDEDITMRRLTLTRLDNDGGGGDPQEEATRPVWHYQYHAWPDHGIPETTRPLRCLAHLLVSTIHPRAYIPDTFHAVWMLQRTAGGIVRIMLARARRVSPRLVACLLRIPLLVMQ